MNILEKFICGKEKNQDLCEDGLFISNEIVAIIDGATSKTGFLLNNMKGGCFAKNSIMKFLEQENIFKLSAKDLFHQMDQYLRDDVSKFVTQIQYKNLPRASVIIYNDYYKEIWSYGDCNFAINDEIHIQSKEIDKINASFRALRLEHELMQGKSIEELSKNDIGRQAIHDSLLMQMDFENKNNTYGYPVMNCNGINDLMVSIFPVQPNSQIILASDGYPMIYNTLLESERYIEKIKKEDPLCMHIFKSTKGFSANLNSFDDRTYCRFTV